MKPKKSLPSSFDLLSLVALALAVPAANAATVIYEQSFTPGAGTTALNGTTPTTGANNWVAAPVFQADGDFTEPTAGVSATLAFTPTDGLVYTLDASIRNLSPTANAAAAENDWVALGFAKGQSTATGNDHRFISNNVIGKAWMLYRGVNTAGTLANVAHLGGATAGNSSSANWTGSLATTYGGGIDMRVVLDTTGGSGNWTATWFAKLPASGTFTEVRAETGLVNEDIDSVGLAISNPGFDGDLTYFSLTSIPEPSAALLGGLGMFVLLRRRR
jgi:hypothetical protein